MVIAPELMASFWKELINPELSRLAEIREKSLALCRLPEFVNEAVVNVRLFELKISPVLVRFLLLPTRFVAELISPSFCKLLARVKEREEVSEAIAALLLLVRLLAAILRLPLERIFLELVMSAIVLMIRSSEAEISPEFISELLRVRSRIFIAVITPEFDKAFCELIIKLSREERVPLLLKLLVVTRLKA